MRKTTFFMSLVQAEELTKRLDAGLEPSLSGKAVLISVQTPSYTDKELERLFGPGYATSEFAQTIKKASIVGAAVDSSNWVNVLKLRFNDVDPSSELSEDMTPFSEQIADEIIDFLEANKDASVFAVHCEAGISRSAGISKFIAQLFGLNFPESYSVYNKFVFSTLMRRWRQRNYTKDHPWM